MLAPIAVPAFDAMAANETLLVFFSDMSRRMFRGLHAALSCDVADVVLIWIELSSSTAIDFHSHVALDVSIV